jgi:heme-degrading monooxygenase HmoA
MAIIEQAIPTYDFAIKPKTPNYADLPLVEGFDWNELAKRFPKRPLVKKKLYAVAFRSVRNPEIDDDILTHFDNAAHAEAMKSNNLLYYFQGEPTPTGKCLSFCIWESKKAAKKASLGPKHQKAVGITREMYSDFTLERYKVKKKRGHLIFRPT